MGLDGTIKRPDGEPLGERKAVQAVIAAVFPGIVFGQEPSGVEKIKRAAKRGIVFPDVIRQHMEAAPAEFTGNYQGQGCSASFFLGPSEVVRQIHVDLRGKTGDLSPMFAELQRQQHWIMTHP